MTNNSASSYHSVTVKRKIFELVFFFGSAKPKRSVIGTANDELKNIYPVDSIQRSVVNFMTNLVAGIIAYNFLPKNHP
ncbi:MAG: hypothetical protein WBY99_03790 [Kaistella sp.]